MRPYLRIDELLAVQLAAFRDFSVESKSGDQAVKSAADELKAFFYSSREITPEHFGAMAKVRATIGSYLQVQYVNSCIVIHLRVRMNGSRRNCNSC